MKPLAPYQHTPAEISELKFEFGHDTNRLASTILSLRKHCAEVERERDLALSARERSASELSTKELERKALAEIVAQQEREIENHSLRANETREVLSALQAKYLKLSEEMTTHLQSALQREQAHAKYVEATAEKLSRLETAVRKHRAATKHMCTLIEENNRMAGMLYNRVIWRQASLAVTNRIQRLLISLGVYHKGEEEGQSA